MFEGMNYVENIYYEADIFVVTNFDNSFEIFTPNSCLKDFENIMQAIHRSRRAGHLRVSFLNIYLALNTRDVLIIFSLYITLYHQKLTMIIYSAYSTLSKLLLFDYSNSVFVYRNS